MLSQCLSARLSVCVTIWQAYTVSKRLNLSSKLFYSLKAVNISITGLFSANQWTLRNYDRIGRNEALNTDGV